MKLGNIVATALMLGLLAACSFPHTDLKSPCAGADGSPCDRHPVNDWWLNPQSGGENS
jgi:hypothetical protein